MHLEITYRQLQETFWKGQNEVFCNIAIFHQKLKEHSKYMFSSICFDHLVDISYFLIVVTKLITLL